MENAFFATTKVPTTGSAKTVTSIPEKAYPTALLSSSTTTDSTDWRNLPFSSIKRKPLTEIMAYVQAKGLAVVGEDGKPLPKSKLLEAIFSM